MKVQNNQILGTIFCTIAIFMIVYQENYPRLRDILSNKVNLLIVFLYFFGLIMLSIIGKSKRSKKIVEILKLLSPILITALIIPKIYFLIACYSLVIGLYLLLRRKESKTTTYE